MALTEPRNDAIAVLRRNPGSSRSSSHNTSPTLINNSPRSRENPRFVPTPLLDLNARLNSPPLTPIPNHLLEPVDEEPDTPSSTIVEFGDLGRGNVPSAAQMVERLHRSFSQSWNESPSARSASKPPGGNDDHEGREELRDQSRSRAATSSTPTAQRDRSQSAQRKQTSAKRSNSKSAAERGLADERINRFLQSMPQQGSQVNDVELTEENRSLYQRIAALQRTERELLVENQDLTRKLAAMKQHHERRARQWNEGFRRKEIEHEAKVRELGEQLLDMVGRQAEKLPGMLSNDDISTWFDEQDVAWNKWAITYGHTAGDRLTTGLHPIQLQELCSDVKAFVRMTDSGKLPPEILNGGKEALRTLLNGMLAHLICTDIIASPMWVLTAASLGSLESPGVVPSKPVPGLPGFRMDMNNFGDVAPLRAGPSQTPRSPQFPPPLITSMIPTLGSTASMLGLPLKPEMERLVQMLSDAQDDDPAFPAYHWRANMMRLFADGGFALKDVAAAGRNEAKRMFVESRLNYARKLKERFLGGSARFLLQDQDAAGIEQLESTLGDLIDEALVFSCRLWTRMSPVRLHGWKDLGEKEVKAAAPLVTLCHAQVEVESRRHKAEISKEKQASQDSQTDHTMVMAVQPAVVADTINTSGPKVEVDDDGLVLVWLKARVMLAGPMSVEDEPINAAAEPPAPTEPTLPSSLPNTAPTQQLPVKSPLKNPQDLEVLPSSSFNQPEKAVK
ncbi:uncharacterized protein C8A04DRAFT_40282 [Dichotomopilus funicola]|uniref:Uncharacterized protein n=1 Tax=Dichotomopilus funicola TaxID=1934379 RepID=A0AAN6UW34_9PEZI|nr:hypothetical protein C8A04DRAFT_40282 [Dichotomopilus funicola]